MPVPSYRLKIYVNGTPDKPMNMPITKQQHGLLHADYVHHFSIGGSEYEILRKQNDTSYSIFNPEVITVLRVKKL